MMILTKVLSMTEQERLRILDVIQADLARLRSEVEELARIESYLLERPRLTEANARSLSESPQRRISPFSETTADIIATVMREIGAPMRAPEIAGRMLESRRVSPRELKQLSAVVFTTLSRRPDLFEKSSPGMWTLKAAELKKDS